MQQLVEIAQLEYGANLACGCGDAEIATRLTGNLEAGDQCAQSGRIDEFGIAEVDDNASSASLDDVAQLFAQPRGGRHVQPARRLDNDDTRVCCASGKVAHL